MAIGINWSNNIGSFVITIFALRYFEFPIFTQKYDDPVHKMILLDNLKFSGKIPILNLFNL